MSDIFTYFSLIGDLVNLQHNSSQLCVCVCVCVTACTPLTTPQLALHFVRSLSQMCESASFFR